MDKAYTPTDYVYPACLPKSALDKHENIRVNVSGWGSLDGKETVCTLFPQDLCQNAYSLRSLIYYDCPSSERFCRTSCKLLKLRH